MIKILIACIMILGISNAVSASEKDFNISCKPFDFKDSFYIKENSKSNLYYNPINKGSCFFLLFEENDFLFDFTVAWCMISRGLAALEISTS